MYWQRNLPTSRLNLKSIFNLAGEIPPFFCLTSANGSIFRVNYSIFSTKCNVVLIVTFTYFFPRLVDFFYSEVIQSVCLNKKLKNSEKRFLFPAIKTKL